MEILVIIIVCVFILPFLAVIVMFGGLIATAIVAAILYVVLWLGQLLGFIPTPK